MSIFKFKKEKKYDTIGSILSERYGENWDVHLTDVAYAYSVETIPEDITQGEYLSNLVMKHKDVALSKYGIDNIVQPLCDAIDCRLKSVDDPMYHYYTTVCLMYFELLEKKR